MDEAAKKAQERIDAEMAAADEKAAAAAQKAVEGEGGEVRVGEFDRTASEMH
ncbi:hypothetical protein [Adlercreutzia faecimuris]|uniref:CsbD family protein n=1 Tax=Adlercreutzia faecimuris TaxID=2897341 RepID=A0ABS9WE54_9ACTN|nr:hypothetical protein [Adlercreutzia sp. JBNU-10]MCI2241136.1 hypothetical protein [Adlercreutzia sp. JBNU-10]